MEATSEALRAVAADGLEIHNSDAIFEQSSVVEIEQGQNPAKLSSKKKEALSQVPCKFFRSNGCSAGNACPFAHITPGEGQGKAVCQWFLKGSCRFGHKCALAHILPGQPISMDRKNKRAAQHMQQQPHYLPQHNQAPHQRQQMPTYNSAVELSAFNDRLDHPSFRDLRHQAGTSSNIQNTLLYTSKPSQASFAHHREADMLFGLPDDFAEVIQDSTTDGDRQGQRVLQNVLINEPVNGRYQDGLLSSKAFGTSPFSNPGSQSVFYSHRDPAPIDEDTRKLFGTSSEKQGSQAVGWKCVGKMEDDSRDEINEEDFLPSSLSDLLTPAELQRRSKGGLRRSNLQISPQSMPTRTAENFAQGDAPIDAVYREAYNQSSDSTSLHPTHANMKGNEQSIFGTSNTSAGFLTSSTRRGLANTVPLSIDSVASSEANRLDSISSSSPTAFAHAAGQSLPHNLAAGLSRLHLQRLEQTHRPSRVSQLATSPSNPSIWSQSRGTHNHNLSTSSSKLSDELGPIAPSSIFAHKSPLHLDSSHMSAMGQAQSTSHSPAETQRHPRISAPFSANVNGSVVPAASISPYHHVPALDQHFAKNEGVESPIDSHISSSELSHGGKINASHPGVQKVRSTQHTGGSPLAFPTHAGEVEEAIFELE